MHIDVTLVLPRDEVSVPVVRHICSHALRELGVRKKCRDAIEVALTEACANVLRHVEGGHEEYSVRVEVSDDNCIIRVIDSGAGFDAAKLDRARNLSAESGRGVALMEALVDDVKFESRPEQGTIVHLRKALEFDDGSPATRLALRTRA